MMIIRIRKGYLTSAALLGAAISVVGCAGDLPPSFEQNSSGSGSGTSSGSGSGSSSSGGTCSNITPAYFATTCGTMAGCHTVNAAPNSAVYGLDLASPNLPSRLVGVKAREPTAPPGTLLIDQATPANSAMYTKVTSSLTYGLQMPFGLPMLDTQTQMCILQWVMTTAASAPPVNTFGSDASTSTTTDAGAGGATNGG